jgi:hypothetical protein
MTPNVNKSKLITAIALYLLGGPAGALPGHTLQDSVQEPASFRLALESELELNDGQKWHVDKAMMLHFRRMEKELKGFRGEESEAYQQLSKSLKATLANLVSECTMKGPAHDELHKWLVPFMKNVDAFYQERDQAALKDRFLELRSSFDVFNAHFQ